MLSLQRLRHSFRRDHSACSSDEELDTDHHEDHDPLRHTSPETSRKATFQPADSDDCDLMARITPPRPTLVPVLTSQPSHDDPETINNVRRSQHLQRSSRKASTFGSLDRILDKMESDLMQDVMACFSRYRAQMLSHRLSVEMGPSVQPECFKTWVDKLPQPDTSTSVKGCTDRLPQQSSKKKNSADGGKKMSLLSVDTRKTRVSFSQCDFSQASSKNEQSDQELEKDFKESSSSRIDVPESSEAWCSSTYSDELDGKGESTENSGLDCKSPMSSTTAISMRASTKEKSETGEHVLLPFWRACRLKCDELNGQLTRSTRSVRGSTLLKKGAQSSFNFRRSKGFKLKNIVSGCANPRGKPRIIWEMLATLLIFHDLVMLPLQVFIYWPGFSGYLAVIQAAYWTCDIPCCFFVGFHERGVIQSKIKYTALHYLKTWFALDFLIVVFDWVTLALEASADSDHGLVRAGQTIRLLRFVRLLRVIRLHTYFSQLMDRIHSEYVWTGIGVLRLITVIVLVNHFVACGWYGLSVMEGNGWDDRSFVVHGSFGYRYATALHWSLTQFTPASMEVVPTNTRERIYAVVVIIVAMVLSSSFISAITEAMAHLRRVNNSKDVKNAALRRYFGDHKVSMYLATRIWRYLEQSVKARQLRKMWHEVELLRELPNSLQKDLQLEVYSASLIQHPFLHNYSEESPYGMTAICHSCIEEISLIEGQDLFYNGEMARGMYFTIEGSLLYCRKTDGTGPTMSCSTSYMLSPNLQQYANWDNTTMIIPPDMWLCEAPLFIEWFHVGSMVARRVSLMLSMDVGSAHKVLLQYHDTLRECVRYAELFLEWVLEDPFGVTDVFMDIDRQLDMSHRAFSREDLLNSGITYYSENLRSGHDLSSIFPEPV